eukprot:2470021-Rhodomonas_salina.1
MSTTAIQHGERSLCPPPVATHSTSKDSSLIATKSVNVVSQSSVNNGGIDLEGSDKTDRPEVLIPPEASARKKKTFACRGCVFARTSCEHAPAQMMMVLYSIRMSGEQAQHTRVPEVMIAG